VDYIAWGKSGNTGYLLSKALENSVNALEYWFETASASQKKKKEFLGSLQGFLKVFHAARFYHPDLHLGNLLFKPDTKTFFIVDPYGIKKTFRISRENQFNIFRILGALRGELDNKEATEILKNAGVADNDKSATELWYRIVEAENSEMEKVWPKRKEKILSGHSKYATVIITDNLKIEIKNNHAGKPLLRPENIKKELNGLAFRKCSGKEARNIWLESFRRQFMRKEKNIRVLAWEKAEDVNIIYHTFPE
jgi:predicted unusual protein kinase regulating ubiquinone biosynthesis (AarF/ABC1/UbiB family)